MGTWFREFLGWLLLLTGLGVFYIAYVMLLARRVLDVIPLCFIGFVVFRGGLHIIKVAVAARAVKEARAQHPEDAKTRTNGSLNPTLQRSDRLSD